MDEKVRFEIDRVAEREEPPPTDSETERAFRTIIRWIGEDPDRDGLHETPKRLVRAFREYFAGYEEDPERMLRKTFEEVAGYDEMIVLRGISFESHCEHHIAPIIGRAWVGYVPNRARRRHLQARARGRGLFEPPADPGAAHRADRQYDREGSEADAASRCVVKATHHCMISRGVHRRGADLVTSRMLGCFRD